MSENTPYPEVFAQQLRDCLSHLYDTAWLQNHEIVAQIIPQATGMARVQAFRRLIIETVASLQTAPAAALSREGRIYSILQYHYIEDQPHHSIIQQLNLSERQYYREHQRALYTITLLIWDQYSKKTSEKSSPSALTLQTESERLYDQTNFGQHSLHGILENTVTLAQASSDAATITIQTGDIPELTLRHINVPILQQLLILLVYQLVAHYNLSGQAGVLDGQVLISARSANNNLTVRLKMQPCSPTDSETLYTELTNHETLSQLLDMLNASLSKPADLKSCCKVELHIPLHPRQVLIIDDNPDALELLERLLQPDYQAVTTRQSVAGFQLAEELQPDLIILDVMLPQVDGWHVLLNLKNNARTAGIPVLICSVLETPDMAKAMGADWYLKKPPTAAELQTALRALNL